MIKAPLMLRQNKDHVYVDVTIFSTECSLVGYLLPLFFLAHVTMT